MPGKTRLRNDLLCFEWDVKPYTLIHSHGVMSVSLSILPQNVDVNVHPTKHEVHFLHEDSVIEAIQRAVDTRLLAANSSRTYYIQVIWLRYE